MVASSEWPVESMARRLRRGGEAAVEARAIAASGPVAVREADVLRIVAM
jgi:hypothetical protein